MKNITGSIHRYVLIFIVSVVALSIFGCKSDNAKNYDALVRRSELAKDRAQEMENFWVAHENRVKKINSTTDAENVVLSMLRFFRSEEGGSCYEDYQVSGLKGSHYEPRSEGKRIGIDNWWWVKIERNYSPDVGARVSSNYDLDSKSGKMEFLYFKGECPFGNAPTATDGPLPPLP